VTFEDILNVTGTSLKEPTRESKPCSSVGFDSTVCPPTAHASIHHFCTDNQYPQLALPLQILSRQSHMKSSQGTRVLYQVYKPITGDVNNNSSNEKPASEINPNTQSNNLVMTGASIKLNTADSLRSVTKCISVTVIFTTRLNTCILHVYFNLNH